MFSHTLRIHHERLFSHTVKSLTDSCQLLYTGYLIWYCEVKYYYHFCFIDYKAKLTEVH